MQPKCIVFSVSVTSLLHVCAGPSGEAPENTAAIEEAADHHSR